MKGLAILLIVGLVLFIVYQIVLYIMYVYAKKRAEEQRKTELERGGQVLNKISKKQKKKWYMSTPVLFIAGFFSVILYLLIMKRTRKK